MAVAGIRPYRNVASAKKMDVFDDLQTTANFQKNKHEFQVNLFETCFLLSSELDLILQLSSSYIFVKINARLLYAR